MSKKLSKKGSHRFKYHVSKVGQRAGSLTPPSDGKPTVITGCVYNENNIQLFESPTFMDALKLVDADNQLNGWIKINGLNSESVFNELVVYPGISPFEVEDVLNNYQRPKIEAQLAHVFIQCRLLTYENDELRNHQLSIFVFHNKVITVSEADVIEFAPLEKRLQNASSMLRQKSSVFLAYTILDTIVDYYFVLVSQLSEKLDTIEEELIDAPTIELRNEIVHIKRNIMQVRKAIWPLRDALNEWMREKYTPYEIETQPYMRDLYDHCVHLMDLVENYREITGTLMDMYMSGVSNRMNEIMKVLTMLSAFFIPLSFISGLYGMNFSSTDGHGNPAPWNMPELYKPWGYIAIITLMATMSSIQAYIFWKKGWFKKG